MAGVLGRLENWVLGESVPKSELFTSDLCVETPHGRLPELRQPKSVRMLVSGGNDEFGSIIFEQNDAETGRWARTCLIYFADEGRIGQVFLQETPIGS